MDKVVSGVIGVGRDRFPSTIRSRAVAKARRLRRFVLAVLGVMALVLLRITWRLRWDGGEPVVGQRIWAFWHGDLIGLFALPREVRRNVTVLVSRSSDGDVAAWIAAAMGLRVVRGSTSRAAVPAVRQLRRRLSRGETVALAVDGPRGPWHAASISALRLAQSSGAVLQLIVAVPTRGVQVRSWDRLMIPAPFSHVVVMTHVYEDGDLPGRLSLLWRRACDVAGRIDLVEHDA